MAFFFGIPPLLACGAVAGLNRQGAILVPIIRRELRFFSRPFASSPHSTFCVFFFFFFVCFLFFFFFFWFCFFFFFFFFGVLVVFVWVFFFFVFVCFFVF